jgi:hypothetical protein
MTCCKVSGSRPLPICQVSLWDNFRTMRANNDEAPRTSNLAGRPTKTTQLSDGAISPITPFPFFSHYARSKRSAFITFVQAATKSLTNFSWLSSWA